MSVNKLPPEISGLYVRSLYERRWQYKSLVKPEFCPDLPSAVKSILESDRASRARRDREWWEHRCRVKISRRWRWLHTQIPVGPCVYCGSPDARSLDHVIPVSRGGPRWDIANLVRACRTCNSSKGNRTPDEWRQRIRPHLSPALQQQLAPSDYLVRLTRRAKLSASKAEGSERRRNGPPIASRQTGKSSRL